MIQGCMDRLFMFILPRTFYCLEQPKHGLLTALSDKTIFPAEKYRGYRRHSEKIKGSIEHDTLLSDSGGFSHYHANGHDIYEGNSVLAREPIWLAEGRTCRFRGQQPNKADTGIEEPRGIVEERGAIPTTLLIYYYVYLAQLATILTNLRDMHTQDHPQITPTVLCNDCRQAVDVIVEKHEHDQGPHHSTIPLPTIGSEKAKASSLPSTPNSSSEDMCAPGSSLEVNAEEEDPIIPSVKKNSSDEGISDTDHLEHLKNVLKHQQTLVTHAQDEVNANRIKAIETLKLHSEAQKQVEQLTEEVKEVRCTLKQKEEDYVRALQAAEQMRQTLDKNQQVLLKCLQHYEAEIERLKNTIRNKNEQIEAFRRAEQIFRTLCQDISAQHAQQQDLRNRWQKEAVDIFHELAVLQITIKRYCGIPVLQILRNSTIANLRDMLGWNTRDVEQCYNDHIREVESAEQTRDLEDRRHIKDENDGDNGDSPPVDVKRESPNPSHEEVEYASDNAPMAMTELNNTPLSRRT